MPTEPRKPSDLSEGRETHRLRYCTFPLIIKFSHYYYYFSEFTEEYCLLKNGLVGESARQSESAKADCRVNESIENLEN